MSNAAVKILFHSSHHSLGAQLQEWLREVSGQVTITNISMDSNRYGHCLAIAYVERSGPAYRGSVWFHSRHDGLERVAKDSLKGLSPARQTFMAVGSNEYGHALCLIDAP